jgi:hypothetical protein
MNKVSGNHTLSHCECVGCNYRFHCNGCLGNCGVCPEYLQTRVCTGSPRSKALKLEFKGLSVRKPDAEANVRTPVDV